MSDNNTDNYELSDWWDIDSRFINNDGKINPVIKSSVVFNANTETARLNDAIKKHLEIARIQKINQEKSVNQLLKNDIEKDKQFIDSSLYDDDECLDDEITSFSDNLCCVLSSLERLLIIKNKAYGNSALEPINIFSKSTSEDVILQQIDHKLSRIKNATKPCKNDTTDLLGYLLIYCINQGWGITEKLE